MPIVTRATFARMAGVNKVQMTKLVKAGKLTAGKGGHLSTNDRKNAEYLKRHGVKLTKRTKKHDRPIALQKAEADLDWKEGKAAREYVALSKELGLVVLLADVRKAYAAFGGEISMRLLNLPRALAARFGLSREQEEVILKEIADAISQAKEKGKRTVLGEFGDTEAPPDNQPVATGADAKRPRRML